ncbi:hypothetical protein HC024_11250, partial [Methylococcaceae bacterium WWC4]|nr:hypothetical protein [Methylococcaceae bacterium WWC4]
KSLERKALKSNHTLIWLARNEKNLARKANKLARDSNLLVRKAMKFAKLATHRSCRPSTFVPAQMRYCQRPPNCASMPKVFKNHGKRIIISDRKAGKFTGYWI